MRHDPLGRSKDLEDLGRLMEQYELEGERRFGEEVFEAGADFESAGAFLLGLDVGRLCKGRGQDCRQLDRGAPGRQPACSPALGQRTVRGIRDRGKAKGDRSVCYRVCHWTAAKPLGT